MGPKLVRWRGLARKRPHGLLGWVMLSVLALGTLFGVFVLLMYLATH